MRWGMWSAESSEPGQEIVAAFFLWFSDIALALTVPALWYESGPITSMMALGILLPEAFWNIGYFGSLVTRKRLGGLTDYIHNL